VEESDPSKAKYSASFIIDPSTKDGKDNIKRIETVAKRCATAKWGKKIPKSVKFPLNDGDQSDNVNYEGMKYFSARDKFQPLVVDRGLNVINAGDPEESIFTHGCRVNVVVTLWCQQNNYGSKTNANLKKIQWVGKGETLKGANQSVDGDFDELEVEDFDEVEV